MAAPTRMETKQRPHKRVMGEATYDTTSGVVTVTKNKVNRPDLRGWSTRNGLNEWVAATDVTP